MAPPPPHIRPLEGVGCWMLEEFSWKLYLRDCFKQQSVFFLIKTAVSCSNISGDDYGCDVQFVCFLCPLLWRSLEGVYKVRPMLLRQIKSNIYKRWSSYTTELSRACYVSVKTVLREVPGVTATLQKICRFWNGEEMSTHHASQNETSTN